MEPTSIEQDSTPDKDYDNWLMAQG
jgi:hypothetical protein